MRSGALPCLIALVTVLPAAGQVDATRRSEAFDPKPSEQERIEKKQIEVVPGRPVAELQQEFVTVPATNARVGVPQFRPRETATIDIAARTVPALETPTARISTAQQPTTFEKKFATPVVARIQDGMTQAGRVKATTAKARTKRNLFERINRFVFRRNHVEPEPNAAPAGGANPPLDGAAAPSESSDS